MASILHLQTKPQYYEPCPRAWHHAATIGDRLYMWGGRTSESSGELPSVIEIYDPYLEAWEQHTTTGVSPPGLYFGGCTSHNESLLQYGGWDSRYHYDTLHQLNIATLNWEELHQKSTSHRPMAKRGCRLVSFQGNKLGLFGGHGHPTGHTQPGSTFVRFSNVSGWTNEFHLFHLQEGVWSSPVTTGSRPPPCGAFSFTAIDSHRAVLFGGYNREHGKMNGVYIINIQTMHWSKLDETGGGPWPVGRIFHAACCLNYGEEHPQLMVSAGMDKGNNTLRDLLVLDVEAGTWKELTLPDVQPRLAHTTTVFNITPSLVEVIMFGGSHKYVSIRTDQPTVAETTILRLGIQSLYQQCIMHIANNYEWYKPLLHHVSPAVRQEIDHHILRQENIKHFPVIGVQYSVPGFSNPYF